MRITKLVLAVELHERVVDRELRQVQSGTQGQLLHIAVTNAKGNQVLELVFKPAVTSKLTWPRWNSEE